MRKIFLLVLFFFLTLWTLIDKKEKGSQLFAKASLEEPLIEIQKIDAEIKELEDMKRGFEARALTHENFAEYLQFEQQAVLETRKHIQIAQENRNKAAMVQERINRLNEKKQQLLK
jgi:hypothetical protein